MRFMHPDKVVHVGETVEWTNDDPITPHTITFGVEPANRMPPSANVTMDPDGALHATVSSPTDNVHSGFISAAPQDQGSDRVTATAAEHNPVPRAIHTGRHLSIQVCSA